MEGYLNYMIEGNIGLMVFLFSYYLFLRWESAYRLARLFLLTGIVASMIFPLIHMQLGPGASAFSLAGMLPAYEIKKIGYEGSQVLQREPSGLTLQVIAFALYASGVLIFTLRFVFSLRRIFLKIKHSEIYRQGKIKICESREEYPSFSFFNFIFIGQTQDFTPAEKKQILEHEMAHARHLHSIDIILIQAMGILFWFNPLLRFYQKALVHLHEFEADAATCKVSDTNQYCSLLARIALRSNGFALVNHFNHSLTLNRISMIRSDKHKINFWKLSVCALVIPTTFFLLSCNDQLRNGLLQDDDLPAVVDEHAYPRNGFDAFYADIRRNIRYPSSSRRDHKYGIVVVKFVISENGTVLAPELVESPDKALGEEAIRLVSLFNEWVPAKKSGVAVKETMVLPIKFRLDIPGKGMQEPKSGAATASTEKLMKEIVVAGYASK